MRFGGREGGIGFKKLQYSGKAMGLSNSLICLSYIENLLMFKKHLLHLCRSRFGGLLLFATCAMIMQRYIDASASASGPTFRLKPSGKRKFRPRRRQMVLPLLPYYQGWAFYELTRHCKSFPVNFHTTLNDCSHSYRHQKKPLHVLQVLQRFGKLRLSQMPNCGYKVSPF